MNWNILDLEVELSSGVAGISVQIEKIGSFKITNIIMCDKIIHLVYFRGFTCHIFRNFSIDRLHFQALEMLGRRK